jgi:hypothetical protein
VKGRVRRSVPDIARPIFDRHSSSTRATSGSAPRWGLSTR